MNPANPRLLTINGGPSSIGFALYEVDEALERRAADAVALFCHQAKQWIGSSAGALAGVDTLVFAGGIGENVPPIRKRIGEGLGFLGSD